jgi:protein-S-isoprenylcysteine O-methyltransferase Ste14
MESNAPSPGPETPGPSPSPAAGPAAGPEAPATEDPSPEKPLLCRIGDFFFRYRNALFPVTLASLFLLTEPRTLILGSAHLDGLLDTVALLFVLAGLGLRAVVIGLSYIKRGGVQKRVYAEHLVTDGAFALCRNPLYVGNLLLYFGLLLLHGAPLAIFVGIGFFFFVYTAIVATEEHYLHGHFGAAYAAYCRDTPRWGFRLAHLHEAIAGQGFNLKKVVAKDYSTIANAFLAIIAITLIADFHTLTHAALLREVPFYLGSVGLLVTLTVAIRLLKKETYLLRD